MSPRAVSLTLIALLLSIPAFAVETPLVSGNSLWRYLNDGSNQGTAWREPGFSDSTWPVGPAQLGYGDGDESTVVPYGPDPARKPVTTYFRQTFFVENPAVFASARIRLIRDDGAVVYVNGQEVFRTNMPGGAIAYNTVASGNSSSPDETMWHETPLDPSLLVAGNNTVAVEVHQEYAGSSDMSFALELLGNDGATSVNLSRGPYLQLGTSDSVIVRWRTDAPTAGRVRYGTSAGSLTLHADDPTVDTDHSVTITGLSPSTRYYYSVGTPTATIAGDASYSFKTSPPSGDPVPTRIWILGDSGTADSSARAVRNAYYNRFGTGSTDLWLMLGDNAYDNGTDPEYQAAVFDMYPEMLRSSVLWPTIGNHDTAGSFTYSPSIAYYDIFTLPTQGEAGGEPSGTERYYSFDYGNIHFICLDSMTTDRSRFGPMMTWLRNDLANNRQKWTIAFWHHPPYSKGGHDSDTETPLVEMRQNALPILEEYGVDLVLGGHSHSYERSYLIDGHYGHSSTFVSSMKIDGGDGRTTPYRKPGRDGHEGAVYAVAGSSGMASGNGPLNHPAMYISLMNMGSLVLEIDGNDLHAKFLRETGAIADSFVITKAPLPAPTAPSSLTGTATTDTVTLQWTDTSTTEEGFRVERCTGTGCTSFESVGTVATDVTSYSDASVTSSTVYRYRVFAYNGTGSNGSNVAEVTTATEATPPAAPSSLTATAVSPSQIDLAWTDNASDEDGFRVERCSGTDCTSFAPVATVAPDAAAYSDSGLSGSTLYRYRVVAFNEAGTAESNVAAATTATPAPAEPSNLTATAVSTSQIDLAWTDGSSNEEGFRVERCSGASCTSFTLVVSLAANAAGYSDSGLSPSTLYRYRIVAFNGAGTAESDVAEATTQTPAPAAPSSLTATAVSTSQIDLAWTDASPDEDGFRVERCSGAGCATFTPIAALGAGVTTFANTGLDPSTLYRYRVVAHNAGGDSAPSNVAEATTQTPAPAAPSSLTATAASTSQIDLAWTDASSNEEGFRVERCSGAACTTFAAIASLGAGVTTFANTGLDPSTLYRYRIVAFNVAGTAESNIAEATTQTPPPAAAANLTATAVSTSQIDLSWTDASSNEAGFRVERCTGTACTTFTAIASLGAGVTTFANTGLDPSTLYRYRVIAHNAGGDSAASNIAEATTQTPVPAAPSNLTATAVSLSQIDLTWTDASSNEAGFRVERCTGAACTTFTAIASLGAGVTTFVNTGLDASTLYRYRVVAHNAGGDSAASNVAEGTTRPPAPAAPSGLTATHESPTRISLRWTDNSTNEEGFRIERCAGSTCTNFAQVAQVAANATAFDNSGLVSATTYRYRVVAFNVTGTATSNIAAATTPAMPPAAPTGLNATVSVGQISLTWIDNAINETSYLVQRCTGASCTSFSNIAQLGANARAYNDTTVAPGITYRYRVIAFNGSVNSQPSNVIQVTASAVPAAPTLLASTAATGSAISLQWNDNSSNESGFRIERCGGKTCTNFVEVGQVGAGVTSFTSTGLVRHQSYRFRVQAFNTSGNSAYSNVIEARTTNR